MKKNCPGSLTSAAAIFENGFYQKDIGRAACPECGMSIKMIGKHVNRVFARHAPGPGFYTNLRGTFQTRTPERKTDLVGSVLSEGVLNTLAAVAGKPVR